MLNCHVKAVRKVMKEFLDLHCFTPATKNKLIQLPEERRVHFAQNYLQLSEEEWQKTIFVDEKIFSTHKDGRLIVWRLTTRYNYKLRIFNLVLNLISNFNLSFLLYFLRRNETKIEYIH